MNKWKDYDLQALINKAKQISEEIKEHFNSPDCPKLNELYSKRSEKTFRNPNEFDKRGYTPNSFLSKKNKSYNEFRGLYFFGEEEDGIVIPVYVGISRTVYRRLKQHGWGKNHNECTLAYLMANTKHYDNQYPKNRSEFPKNKLDEAKRKVQNFKVVLYYVPDDYKLYFLEVAIASILKTKWNSFKTH